MIDTNKIKSVLVGYVKSDRHAAYDLSKMISETAFLEIEHIGDSKLKIIIKTRSENIVYFDERKKYLEKTLSKLLAENFEKPLTLENLTIIALSSEESVEVPVKEPPSYWSIIIPTLVFAIIIWQVADSLFLGILAALIHPFIARLVSGVLHTICETIDDVYELREENKIGVWTRNVKMNVGAWWPVTIFGVLIGLILIIFGALYKNLF